MASPSGGSNQSQGPFLGEIQSFIDAAKGGDLSAVTDWLDKYGHAIINEKDGGQDTALTWAAYHDHVDVVTLLLERGAPIDEKGMNGGTALVWAAQAVREAAIDLLLEKGASVDIQNDSGMTAAESVKAAGREDLAEKIEQYSEVRKQQLEEQAARLRAMEKEREMAVAAERMTEDRIDRLKKDHPHKSVLKKNQPRR